MEKRTRNFLIGFDRYVQLDWCGLTLEAAIENLVKLTDLLVIKRGERGAFAQYKEQRVSFDSVGQSKVLDTTGAGDAFAAGFISSWFRNKDLKAALEKGTEYAQKCINKVGARPPIPNSF